MRWTGWILAAIAVGCASVASGGQPCCQGCGGCGVRCWGPLSGEACCSPPGLSLSAWGGPSCCCGNQCPCCDNAWDGYCHIMPGFRRVGPRSGCRKPSLLPVRYARSAGEGLCGFSGMRRVDRAAEAFARGRCSCSQWAADAFCCTRPAVQEAPPSGRACPCFTKCRGRTCGCTGSRSAKRAAKASCRVRIHLSQFSQRADAAGRGVSRSRPILATVISSPHFSPQCATAWNKQWNEVDLPCVMGTAG